MKVTKDSFAQLNKATDKQIQAIENICEFLGEDTPSHLKSISKVEAIKTLKKLIKRAGKRIEECKDMYEGLNPWELFD